MSALRDFYVPRGVPGVEYHFPGSPEARKPPEGLDFPVVIAKLVS